MKRISYFLGLALFMIACAGEEAKNESLEQLISKRDSLKTELAGVNAQIAAMDTVKEEVMPLVTSSEVMIKNFSHKVEVQGAVETDKNAMVNAEASGTIDIIHVKEGQKVSKGQALITINAEILASNIEEVETSLELAEYMLEKQQKLMDEGLGVEIEYEQALNQKKSLEKRLKTMKAQKGKTVVRAPFTGIVDDIMVNVGELAAPQFPLLRIVNNDKVTVTASLSENLLAKVDVGTAVDLRIPSLDDTTIITQIATKGNYIDPVNRTFKVIVELNNNTLLLPNQLAKVNVTDYVKDSALVVNSQTILQDTKNRNYVYKMVDKENDTYGVQKVFVEVHKRYRGEACISPMKAGSLSDSDILVLDGAKGITEKDRVKIQ
ncbi:MAG: efflux RND transporter periplasmic adaptor subunit [Flavobacteriales bacterium]|nr:efflux RND transporter periplasmic adaptor subunit [Flavobacteriales bacterium]